MRFKLILFIFFVLINQNNWALTCSVSAQPVAFGTYNPFLATNTDSSATISVTCSDLISILVSYSIRLSTGGGGSYNPRKLIQGSNQLNYNLYTNAARTTIWGDGTAGTQFITDGYLLSVIFPVTRNYTVYGRIPPLQNVASGLYSDTITVTVTY